MLRMLAIFGAVLALVACDTVPSANSSGERRYSSGPQDSCYARGVSFCLVAPAQIMRRDPIKDSMLYLVNMRDTTYYIYEGSAANVAARDRTPLRRLRSVGGPAEYKLFFERRTHQVFIQRPANYRYPEMHIWVASANAEEEDIRYILSNIRLD